MASFDLSGDHIFQRHCSHSLKSHSGHSRSSQRGGDLHAGREAGPASSHTSLLSLIPRSSIKNAFHHPPGSPSIWVSPMERGDKSNTTFQKGSKGASHRAGFPSYADHLFGSTLLVFCPSSVHLRRSGGKFSCPFYRCGNKMTESRCPLRILKTLFHLGTIQYET